jgi:hypothetical protein
MFCEILFKEHRCIVKLRIFSFFGHSGSVEFDINK